MASDSHTLAKKVLSRCDEIGECSSEPGRITRLYLSEPMRAVHHRVQDWMHQAGLSPHVDNVGNCIGRLRSAAGEKILLVGSHLDSVPGAGRYDGVLGTVLAIAVCEWLGERTLPFHLDVVGFSEEEGVRYKMPYLGSAAVCGQFDPGWLQREDDDKITMRDAMQAFGLSPDDILDCKYDPRQVIGYVEPHLEQGRVLEELAHPVGIVTGIAGQSRLRMTFEGEAGHAGTANIAHRRDALVAAATFVQEVRNKAVQTAGLKATVGTLRVYPNTPNVIPGRVALSLDVRHLDDEERQSAVDNLIAKGHRIASAENCSFKVLEEHTQTSVGAEPKLMSALAEAVGQCGQEIVHLESGAGHDAAILGLHFPMAMLFVRHPGGVSHHPDERVELDDVATAIEVLGRFVLKIADRIGEEESSV